MAENGIRSEKVLTVGMKRRSVIRVLKSVMKDAEREVGRDRVTGIFGVVIKEDGTAALVTAATVVEMRVIMKAIPSALHSMAQALERKAVRKES
jgi:hypothetical protein